MTEVMVSLVHEPDETAFGQLGKFQNSTGTHTPSWKLAIPHQGVAAHEHLVAQSPIYDGVGRTVREPAARGLGGVPLLGIIGCVLAEVFDVVFESIVRRVVAVAWADRRPEIEESGVFGESVELSKDHQGACHEAGDDCDLHRGLGREYRVVQICVCRGVARVHMLKSG